MRPRMWTVLVSMLLIATGMPVTAEQNAKQHRLVERSFHPLSDDDGINLGPPAVQITEDDRLYAYVGSWPILCPTQTTVGVEVVDLTDPDEPELIGVIHAAGGGSAPKDVWIFTDTDANGERRDLLIVSRQACVEGELVDILLAPAQETVPYPWTGFEIHDVTDPRSPEKLGEWVSGGVGVHNLSVVARPDLGGRVFVAATLHKSPRNVLVDAMRFHVLGEREDVSFYDGWLKIVEITDPASPELVASWGIPDHQDETLCIPRGQSPLCWLHDVQLSDDGKTAYLAYWDAGVVLLDIEQVDEPKLIAQWFPPPDPIVCDGQAPAKTTREHTTADGDTVTITTDDDGATHTVVPIRVDGRDLLLVTDEEWSAPVQGFLRVVDVTDPPSRTVQPPEWEQVATYLPPRVCSQDDVFFTHQAWPGPRMPGGGNIPGAGNVYLSAVADGLRVLSLSEGGREVREVAWFVPDDNDHDNDRDDCSDAGLLMSSGTKCAGFEGSTTLHHPRTGELLILVSDHLRGLYVLEPSNARRR